MSELPDVQVVALRRLARGLLYDRHGAEDVVQEAWLAALRARPTAARLGAWLGETVRRLARNRRREEARRRAREERAAQVEALAGEDERSARIEILRRLLDALDRLGEPYRSAVVLRYLEDLPPRDIARRLGIPVNTARTHVRRGLERLRRDLDGERGRGREELLAALAPVAGKVPWGVAGPWRAVLTAKNEALLAAGLVLVIGLSWILFHAASQMGTGESSGELAAASRAKQEPIEVSTDLVEPSEGRTGAREPLGSSTATRNATWVVRGHAFRDRGKPFPDLPLVGRVYAWPEDGGTLLVQERFATDQNGDFSWAIVPPEDIVTVVVDPEVSEHITEASQGVFFPGDPAPDRWTVAAYPLDTIVRGRVVDPSGKPIPGARIVSHQEVETRSDADGRYLVRLSSGNAIAGWEQELVIAAPGFAVERLKTALGGDVQAPDVILKPGLRVRGKVIDESGSPVVGAEVYSEWPAEPVLTGADGAFELGSVAPQASAAEISVVKQGYSAANRSLDRPPPPDIQIRLTRGVQVTGIVLGPDRVPVWGAWISLDGVGGNNPDSCTTFSDGEGRFALEHVPAMRTRLWVRKNGFALKRMQVKVPGGAAAFDVELTLDEQEHFLGGLVLDELGRPVPWARLQISDAKLPFGQFGDTYTGPDGRFLIRGLPAKRTNLQVFVGELCRVEQDFTRLDRDDLVLRMRPTSVLAGRVVEADTGAPVRLFTVRVGGPPPSELDDLPYRGDLMVISVRYPNACTFDAPDGSWALETEHEPGEAYSLRIEAPGHVPGTVAMVRSAVDPSPDDVVVRLARTTRVRGHVVQRGTGAPFEGARVRRLAPGARLESLENSPEPAFEDTTDPAGRFELDGVPTGEMLLAVEAPGCTPAFDGPFVVSGPDPIDRSIELGPGATIRGRLVGPHGIGVPGETVELEALDGPRKGMEWAAGTDAAGDFVFSLLGPARYELSWNPREDRALWHVGQEITMGGEKDVETELGLRGSATLRGTIEFAGGVPRTVEAWIRPVVALPETPSSHLPANAVGVWAIDGAFQVDHLEPGEYEVSVEFEIGPVNDFGYGVASASGAARVLVPAGGSVEVRVMAEQRED